MPFHNLITDRCRGLNQFKSVIAAHVTVTVIHVQPINQMELLQVDYNLITKACLEPSDQRKAHTTLHTVGS